MAAACGLMLNIMGIIIRLGLIFWIRTIFTARLSYCNRSMNKSRVSIVNVDMLEMKLTLPMAPHSKQQALQALHVKHRVKSRVRIVNVDMLEIVIDSTDGTTSKRISFTSVARGHRVNVELRVKSRVNIVKVDMLEIETDSVDGTTSKEQALQALQVGIASNWSLASNRA